MSYDASFAVVKDLVSNIERLAKEMQLKIDLNQSILLEANELVAKSSTFVFALGEVYALQNVGLLNNAATNSSRSSSVRPTTLVKMGRGNSGSKYDKRDCCGRFCK